MSIETKHHSPIVYRLYDELKKHVGRKNAISAYELSKKFDITERQLRDYIREIRESSELEKCIDACNFGYYVCTKEESRYVSNRLYAQAFSLLKTARANEKKAGLDGQMKIALGEFYKQTFESTIDSTLN